MNPQQKDREKSVHNLFERLGHLYPIYPDGNGNGHGGLTHWKGKKIISEAEWKQLSGLAEMYTRYQEIQSRAAAAENAETLLGYPEDVEKELDSVWKKREFRPASLAYFPDGFVSAAVSPCWSCPQDPDLFHAWISDYIELLKLMGVDPEQEARERYQQVKKIWDFHKSSWYRRGVNGYDGYGCNQYTGCIPECKFYPSEGTFYVGEGYD